MKPIKKSYSAILLIGFGSILVLMMALIISSLVSMNKTRQQLNIVVDEHLAKVALSINMRTAARNRTLILFQFMYFDDPFERDDAWLKFNESASDFILSRNKIFNMSLTELERNLLRSQGKLSNIASPTQKKIIDLVNEGKYDDASFLLNEKAVPAQASVLDILDRFVAYQRSMAQNAQAEAIHEIEKTRNIILLMGVAALLAGISISFIIVKIIRHRSELDIYHTTHDSLTQLPNRALLIDRLEQTVSHSKRNNTNFAVLFIDVDRFKLINDTYGHAQGDIALLLVRDKLRKQLREIDTLARLSGDEFVILLEDVDDKEAVIVIADRIVADFHSLVTLENNKVKISVSIGIALSPKDGDTPDLLLKNADMAMYESKKKGRDCWSMY